MTDDAKVLGFGIVGCGMISEENYRKIVRENAITLLKL